MNLHQCKSEFLRAQYKFDVKQVQSDRSKKELKRAQHKLQKFEENLLKFLVNTENQEFVGVLPGVFPRGGACCVDDDEWFDKTLCESLKLKEELSEKKKACEKAENALKQAKDNLDKAQVKYENAVAMDEADASFKRLCLLMKRILRKRAVAMDEAVRKQNPLQKKTHS